MEDYANRRKSVMTVGRALPGMMDIGRNASSNIMPTDKCIDLLKEASGENGCVKVVIEDEKLVGTKLFRIKVAERPWEEKFDELAKKADPEVPCLFVLYRSKSNVLLVKYIPENAKTRTKMMYASSTSSLKNAIIDLGDSKLKVEEYNVSSLDELSMSEYNKMKNIEAPLTEAEIARREQESAETAGAYSLLARLSVNRPPVALPGLASKQQINPRYLRDPSLEEESEQDDAAEEEDSAKNETGSDSSESGSDEDENKGKRLSVTERVKSIDKSKQRKSSRKSSKTTSKPIVEDEDEDEENEPYPYTLEDIIKMKELEEYDDYMDRSQLELYITAKEFKKHFGMSKNAFKDLPNWKRVQMKKKVGLF